jgi:hypothetical protein
MLMARSSPPGGVVVGLQVESMSVSGPARVGRHPKTTPGVISPVGITPGEIVREGLSGPIVRSARSAGTPFRVIGEFHVEVQPAGDEVLKVFGV